MEKPYDYLIVGAGLFGAVCAHELRKSGHKCLVIDKRMHAGGNLYCENVNGIQVHKYGAHIFHTNDLAIWNYVNQLVPFRHYNHSVMANYKGKLFNLPFNMNTFYQLWQLKTPEEVIGRIAEQRTAAKITDPANLEEQAISMVGADMYHTLIKGYTEKQWGRFAKELPASIIKRLPLRFTYDNSYFSDRYQGIPAGGYNKLIDALLADVEVRLNIDYLDNKDAWQEMAETIIFTGPIDAWFNYCYGRLEYRSLSFEQEILPVSNFQGCAVMNYTDSEVPYTRIIEHKHFEGGQQPFSVITYEYPQAMARNAEPYYPVNDSRNNNLYTKYKQAAAQQANVIFGGRLAEYKYYDMDQIIGSALSKMKKLKAGLSNLQV
ncbi:UDP-galactopyranose mutase [Chitinophaga silvisoli]|uniref:UDP-galactopyranose mutase n=1 Tax=Chitinophaga silvisoli TaxID=2291814 RepID=A0A3E1P432_9BACT|nr:UDP-galactopyranose mutase [Chitinophaga silvisoli]RFM34935.1 UDP-galactopyranose mutase [Chitinophaga silvisoli]